jgi:hypothetical protein
MVIKGSAWRSLGIFSRSRNQGTTLPSLIIKGLSVIVAEVVPL